MAAPEKFDQATDAEIERERVKWTAERLAEHLKFVRQFTFHTSTTFMDYLHGDVDEEEAELGCRYEYARELKAVWEAAKQRDEWKVKGLDWFSDKERDAWKKLSPAERSEKAALCAYQASQLHGETSFQFDTLSFLVCESFPKKDWQALTPAERKAIARFERRKIPPLPMTDVWTLKATGVLDKFKIMGEEAKPVVEDVPPGKKAKPIKLMWPVLQKWESVYYAVFDVDYSKSATQLAKEFLEWLKLPENQERLDNCKRPRIGTTGKPLDRLKDLAAWRLYREHGNDWNKANDFARVHRKKFTSAEIHERFKTQAQRAKLPSGSNKPFRDAKWQAGNPANEADLFGEDADARKAQASAWRYMVEIMPHEFAPPGPHMLASFVEIGKLESKG
jgi:hypothetical protein